MKQHITIEQLDELSEMGKKKLRKWYYPKRSNGDLIIYHFPINPVYRNTAMIFGERPMYGDPTPLLSIGQMIEFLEEWQIYKYNNRNKWKVYSNKYKKYFRKSELCDALWEAVKEVLEKGKK